jgi:hydrogenase maturation protease
LADETEPGLPAAHTVVVGCGNLIRGDDAAGPVLVRLLAERGVPAGVRLVDGGTAGMDVAFALRGAVRAIVVDASRVGVPAGTVHRVPGQALVDLRPPEGNLHRFRWDQALGFAQWLLGADYPQDVTVWLVEGESFEPGAPLSPPVQAAVERVAGTLMAELGAGGSPGGVRSSGPAAPDDPYEPDAPDAPDGGPEGAERDA